MSNWWSYVQKVSGSATQAQIADHSGISQPVVSRWKSGDGAPSADSAVQFARAYGRPAVEALVAAGVLRPSDATKAIRVDRNLEDFSARELVEEIYRRIPEGEQ